MAKLFQGCEKLVLHCNRLKVTHLDLTTQRFGHNLSRTPHLSYRESQSAATSLCTRASKGVRKWSAFFNPLAIW
ncbi:hypothetical protein ACQP3J_31940, partial [Escherichia coli]